MSDAIEEIRRWHKLNRDTTSLHWQHVDDLLAALGNTVDQIEDIDELVSDLEVARSSIDEVLDALKPHKKKRRKVA